MDTGKALGQIVGKIRDQRFLFALGSIVIVAGLAPFHLLPSMAILASAVILVVLDRVLGFLGTPDRRTGGQAQGLAMSVALEFEGLSEGTAIRLVSGTCTIQDPRNPRRMLTRQVVPYPQGSGWLCPIPVEARPDDVVNFALTDGDGQRWGMMVVPRLLWPMVKVELLH
jgi:hypothetical protein